MRFAAQRTIALQDNYPSGDTVYMPDIVDKQGSMIKALRDWERRRGITFSYKGRFIQPKKKIVEKKAKFEPSNDRPIKVPRTKRPKQTAEEKQKLKNESNKLYRTKDVEAHRQRSKDWRAKLTPQQKAEVARKLREWRATRKANANSTNGVPVA
jgi:hypothetical protein